MYKLKYYSAEQQYAAASYMATNLDPISYYDVLERMFPSVKESYPIEVAILEEKEREKMECADLRDEIHYKLRTLTLSELRVVRAAVENPMVPADLVENVCDHVPTQCDSSQLLDDVFDEGGIEEGEIPSSPEIVSAPKRSRSVLRRNRRRQQQHFKQRASTPTRDEAISCPDTGVVVSPGTNLERVPKDTACDIVRPLELRYGPPIYKYRYQKGDVIDHDLARERRLVQELVDLAASPLKWEPQKYHQRLREATRRVLKHHGKDLDYPDVCIPEVDQRLTCVRPFNIRVEHFLQQRTVICRLDVGVDRISYLEYRSIVYALRRSLRCFPTLYGCWQDDGDIDYLDAADIANHVCIEYPCLLCACECPDGSDPGS